MWLETERKMALKNLMFQKLKFLYHEPCPVYAIEKPCDFIRRELAVGNTNLDKGPIGIWGFFCLRVAFKKKSSAILLNS